MKMIVGVSPCHPPARTGVAIITQTCEETGELQTKFETIDPAPPADPSLSTAQLLAQLMDGTLNPAP